MSGGGGSSKSTTSTKVELPSWYEGYAKDAAERGYNQSLTPYQQYSGERIAPLTGQQTQGLDLVSQLGANNPLTAAANQQAMATLSGQYLDPSTNPAWAAGQRDITDAYQTGTAATRNAAFSKAGAFGSDNTAFNQYSAMQDQGLGNSLGGLWGDLYNKERGNQMATLGMTPSLNQTTYGDYQNLIGAGDAQRTYNQDLLNLNYSDFLEEQQYPWTQLQNFASLAPSLLGNSGSTTTTGPNPYQTSPLAGAVGGGLSGAGAGAMLGGTIGPWGIPIGALIGAIAGGALSS